MGVAVTGGSPANASFACAAAAAAARPATIELRRKPRREQHAVASFPVTLSGTPTFITSKSVRWAMAASFTSCLVVGRELAGADQRPEHVGVRRGLAALRPAHAARRRRTPAGPSALAGRVGRRP